MNPCPRLRTVPFHLDHGISKRKVIERKDRHLGTNCATHGLDFGALIDRLSNLSRHEAG
jgi:hypothetical protein